MLATAARFAAARGAMLFRLDAATELARAAMRGGEVGGGHLVAFVDDGEFGVACVEEGLPARLRTLVRFDGTRALVSVAGEPAPAVLEAMAAARGTVARAELVPPTLPSTVLVVSPTGPAAELEAYAVRLASGAGDLVLGVHWRARLSGDGRVLRAREPLSRAAITIPASGGRLPERIELAHQGACPTEMHHYLSLKHGVAFDLFALDSEIWWRVEGERSEPYI